MRTRGDDGTPGASWNSMTDLFGEWVSDETLDRIFAVMALCPHHVFQVLTKRAERMRDYCKRLGRHNTDDRVSLVLKEMAKAGKIPADTACWYTLGDVGWHLQNVWLGVSVEDQPRADERIPVLLDTPAAVRWVSVEPMLGPVDLNGWVFPVVAGGSRVDWVVAGSESGPGARPCDLDWVRGIRDQCSAAGVAFFWKDAGSNIPPRSAPDGRDDPSAWR
jgi:protein gp37